MALSDRVQCACPPEAELRRLHAHELAPDTAQVIEGHLANCPACAARHAALLAEHNTWIGRLRLVGVPPQPTSPAPIPPPDIPGYEIRTEISRGGQGIVYRALQVTSRRDVAIKVLREGPYATAATRRRFEREIELVAGLNHPHIVTVFDSGETADRRRYYVMDFAPGLPLDRYLATRRPPVADRLRLFARVCQAVNYAHQRGVIHRDLKPSNVLVADDGHPRILDFGLARHVPEPGAAAMTTAGEVAGTLPYMSPEQARGLPDAVDVRSDVYALGVMLYEMLTGRFPYPVSGDVLQVLRHIVESEPTRVWRRPTPAATGAPPRIDLDLETILLKALAKERERRYQSAGELARDVEHYLAGEPIEARRDSGVYVLRKLLQRYRFAALAALAFVTVITGAALALGVMYTRQAALRAAAEHHAAVARTAEATAERRFAQVRELANYFVLQFDPLLAHVPGAAPARRALVEKSLTYLDALAREARDDVDLQLEVAAAYMTIGDVQGDVATASLGDARAALESYGKADQLLADLAVRLPGEHRVFTTTLLNLLKIGDARQALGDLPGAQSVYETVIQRGDERLAELPDDRLVRGNVANAHQRLGSTLLSRGEVDAAQAHFDKYAQLVEINTPPDPNDVWRLRSVGVNWTKIAGVHYAQGRLSEALECYQKFLETSQRVQAAHPSDVVARRDLGIAHQWIGIIQADLKQPEPAQAAFEASNAVFDALLRDDPTDSVAQTQLATNWSKLGEIHLAAGHTDEAQRSFARSAELVAAVARAQPDRPDVLRLLGVSYYKLAELARTYGQDTARPVAERRAHWQAARDWLDQCRSVFVDMRARDILSPGDAAVPAELAAEIAGCDAELSALDGAPPTSQATSTPTSATGN